MTAVRRILTLIGFLLAMVISSSIPASATFTDTAAVGTTVGTLTVLPPTGLTLNDYCTTTTTTVKRTVYTDPVTGATSTTYYSSTSSTTVSSSNVQGTTTTTEPGPGPNESTTTTVTKDTDLRAALSWTGSTSRGVNGYRVSARLNDGSIVQLLTTTGTSASRVEDADVLVYQPTVLVTTLTTYRWTANSLQTRVLAC